MAQYRASKSQIINHAAFGRVLIYPSGDIHSTQVNASSSATLEATPGTIAAKVAILVDLP